MLMGPPWQVCRVGVVMGPPWQVCGVGVVMGPPEDVMYSAYESEIVHGYSMSIVIFFMAFLTSLTTMPLLML